MLLSRRGLSPTLGTQTNPYIAWLIDSNNAAPLSTWSTNVSLILELLKVEPQTSSSPGGKGSTTEPHPSSALAFDAKAVLPSVSALRTVLLLTQLLHFQLIGRTCPQTTRDSDVDMFILWMHFSEKQETS